jgi:hypothetical protein
MKSKPRIQRLALCGLMLTAFTVATKATDLSNQQLIAHWTPANGSERLGQTWQSTALSSKWALMGAPNAKTLGVSGNGSVAVFNAATLAWTRTILPPAGSEPQGFGTSIALWGDLAVIGAPNANGDTGKAYLYNVSTGQLVRTFVSDFAAAGNKFGSSVAINGDLVAIGSPFAGSGVISEGGRVEAFSISTGLAVFNRLGSLSGGQLGTALALEGSILAVSVPYANSSHGSIFFYDMRDYVSIKFFNVPSTYTSGGLSLAMHQGRVIIGSLGKALIYDFPTGTTHDLTPITADASFGFSVAIEDRIAVVGAPFAASSTGYVQVFDSLDGSSINALTEPNTHPAACNFGASVAVANSVLLSAAPLDAADSGAGYVVKPITRSSPFFAFAAKGNYAPIGTEVSYGTMNDPVINGYSQLVFTSPLAGPASNGGRDVGLFQVHPGSLTTDGWTKTRSIAPPFLSQIVASLGTTPLANSTDFIMGLGTRSGTGVATTSNQFIYWTTTATTQSFTLLDAAGYTAIGALDVGSGAPSITSFADLAQSNRSGSDKWQYATMCKLLTGYHATTAANDSSIFVQNPDSTEGVREDSAAPALSGLFLGQISPRVALFNHRYAYTAALEARTGSGVTTANNAVLYRRDFGSAEQLIARKGVTAVNDRTGAARTGISYSAFIGESLSDSEDLVFRATISGSGVTSSTNEGLFDYAQSSGAVYARLMKGDPIGGLPSSAKVIGFSSFWAMPYADSFTTAGNTLAVVTLGGSGVNSSNNQVLVLVDGNGNSHSLLRKGDPAPGCPGACIASISRVACDGKSGAYALIATLSGAATGTELALYTGNILRGDLGTSPGGAALKCPFLRLRKGQLFDNQPSKVKSFSFVTDVTPSGAGGTGHGRCISSAGAIGLTVDFDNGVHQTMFGGVD